MDEDSFEFSGRIRMATFCSRVRMEESLLDLLESILTLCLHFQARHTILSPMIPSSAPSATVGRTAVDMVLE